MSRPPDVSVAVSTYQRASLLPRLLGALARQTLPVERFEVVVVDNGSTDDTGEVLERLAASLLLRLRTIRVEVNRGPAAGRNAAWRAGTAPIVAFTDDDVEPTRGWLEAGLAAVDGARVVAVGRTEPNPEQRHLLDRPFTRTVRVEDARFFQTCNVFYRRDDLEAVGGFDEGFGRPGGEDTDLGLRVCALGATPIFLDEALVYHDVRPSSLAATVRETLRWTGIPRAVRRHPVLRRTMLTHRVFWRPAHPSALLALIGLILAPRRKGALLLVAPWVRFRTRVAPLCPGPRRRWLVLPAGLAIDLLEVGVMASASLRERTVVL